MSPLSSVLRLDWLLTNDRRVRYVATGGMDTIVNLFDTEEWICARTITCSEYPTNALSFSHDGEYLAIASQGSYIDIVRPLPFYYCL